MLTAHSNTTGPRTNSNGSLTVIAILLGFLVLDRAAGPAGRGGGLGPAEASAQVRSVSSGPGSSAGKSLEDEPTDGRVNPADQRKQMIAELRNISQRLDRLESVISKGLTVKVTDMPEMKLPKALEARLGEKSGN